MPKYGILLSMNQPLMESKQYIVFHKSQSFETWEEKAGLRITDSLQWKTYLAPTLFIDASRISIPLLRKQLRLDLFTSRSSIQYSEKIHESLIFIIDFVFQIFVNQTTITK